MFIVSNLLLRFPRLVGNVPESAVENRDKSCNASKVPIHAGIVPLSILLYTENDHSRESVHIDEGSVLVSALLLR